MGRSLLWSGLSHPPLGKQKAEPSSQTQMAENNVAIRGQQGAGTSSVSKKVLLQQNLASLTLSTFKKTKTLIEMPIWPDTACNACHLVSSFLS